MNRNQAPLILFSCPWWCCPLTWPSGQLLNLVLSKLPHIKGADGVCDKHGIQPASCEVCLSCHGTHPLQKTHSFLFCWQRMNVEDSALWPQELLGMGFVEHYPCPRWIKGSVWEGQDGMPESINSNPHSLPAIHSLLLGFIFQTKTSAKSTHGIQICIV